MQHYSLVEDLIDHSIFLLKAYTMMFSYHQVKERPKLLLAMTGLNHAEFAQLLPHFQSALDQYVQHNGRRFLVFFAIILIETIANVNMVEGNQSRP